MRREGEREPSASDEKAFPGMPLGKQSMGWADATCSVRLLFDPDQCNVYARKQTLAEKNSLPPRLHPALQVMPPENKYRPVDNRRFARTGFRAAAKLLLAPATVTPCEILDVGEGGLGIAISTPLSSGARCMISFDCPYEGKSRRLNAWGRVIYSKECGQAFRTGVQLLDMDSFSRLLLQKLQGHQDLA